MTRIVIFGTGQLAEIIHDYIEEDGQFEIVAFTADEPAVNTLCGLPVVDFEDVTKLYDPSEYRMLVVIGFSERNQKRRRVFERVRKKGYRMVNYIHGTSIMHKTTVLGENCIILENNVFQPHVTVGDDSIMMSSNLIGHHVDMKDHCFLAGHACIGGRVTVGSGSIFGMNSTVKQRVNMAERTFVGAGVFLRQDTIKGAIYEAPDPKIILPEK